VILNVLTNIENPSKEVGIRISMKQKIDGSVTTLDSTYSDQIKKILSFNESELAELTRKRDDAENNFVKSEEQLLHLSLSLAKEQSEQDALNLQVALYFCLND